MPIYITQGRYTRDAIKGMIGVSDLRTLAAMTSVEATGAFAAASDLAPGFKSAGAT